MCKCAEDCNNVVNQLLPPSFPLQRVMRFSKHIELDNFEGNAVQNRANAKKCEKSRCKYFF